MPVKTSVITRRVVDRSALYREIGKKMRRVRERAGLSQETVGIALGMTRANVSSLEAGKTRILLEHIYNAAMAMKVPASEFLP